MEPAESYFEILEIVRSSFELKDAYLEDGVPTFIIIPDPGMTEKIEGLSAKLHERGLRMIIHRGQDEIVLRVISMSIKPRISTGFRRLNLPIILFVATIITVTISGYFSANNHIGLLKMLNRLNLSQAQENVYRLELTLMYTVSVMGVLGLHELGHLLACRIHNVKASLPLFIPGIPGITIGTFGAVVRQESPALNRNQLFDIGFSGPIFGFIAAIIVSYLGYSWSIPVTYAEYMSVTLATGPGQWIVPPAIFLALERFILPSPSSYTHFLHPVAWAGWICTLITFLNAFPIGQLDGGHVSRALLGQRWHKRLSYIMPVVMILAGWWQMALLALFFFRAVHPGALDDVSKVTRNRKIGGLLFILIFIACFTFTWESVIRMLLYP